MMVNQNETNTVRPNNLTNKDNFSAEHFSSTKSQINLSPDELIVSLANSHENKRAGQVTEWESLRTKNVRRQIASFQ